MQSGVISNVNSYYFLCFAAHFHLFLEKKIMPQSSPFRCAAPHIVIFFINKNFITLHDRSTLQIWLHYATNKISDVNSHTKFLLRLASGSRCLHIRLKNTTSHSLWEISNLTWHALVFFSLFDFSVNHNLWSIIINGWCSGGYNLENSSALTNSILTYCSILLNLLKKKKWKSGFCIIQYAHQNKCSSETVFFQQP